MTNRRVRIGTRLVAGVTCLALFLGPAVSAAGEGFVPHQAFYVLSLDSARPGSTVTNARGAMFLEWEEDCEGWSSSQRFQLQLFDSVAPTVEIDSRFASWEAGDGLAYHFTVQNLRNGRMHEEFRGGATLTGEGEEGMAKFVRPEPTRLELPAGTVFPFKHLREVIGGALAGDKVIFRLVFDGTDDEGVFEVNGVVGMKHPADPEDASLPPSARRPFWDMRFAFFHRGREESVPFYELTVRLLDNGIARQFLLDYGESVIRVDLDRVELLPRPTC